jgi:hypothetical protein
MSVSAELVQAVFVIPPRVHLLDITGPAHVFYEASDYGAPLKMHFCNIHTQEHSIQSSSSLFLSNLINYNDLNLQPGDVIFVPGLESSLLMDDGFLTSSRAFQYWLKSSMIMVLKSARYVPALFYWPKPGCLIIRNAPRTGNLQIGFRPGSLKLY